MNYSRTKLFAITVSFIIGFGTSLSALSAMFNIRPTQLHLSTKTSVGLLKLSNPTSEPTTVQISVKRWTQVKGVDHYEPTRDLLALPGIAHIAPYKTQMIRVALRVKPDAIVERTYRVYLRQVLSRVHVKERKDSLNERLRIAIRMSLPVFISPIAPAKERWVWEARPLTNNKLQVTLKNTGTKTLFINKLNVYTKNDKEIASLPRTFAYVLPAQQHTWSLKIAPKNKARVLRLDLVKATVNHHEITAHIHGKVA